MSQEEAWTGESDRRIRATMPLDAPPQGRSNKDFWDSPFWRVMAFIFTAAISGAGLTAWNAMAELRKVSDSQIRFETKLEGMVLQQAESKLAVQRLDDRLGTVEQKQVQLETIISETHRPQSTNLNRAYESSRHP